MTIGYSRERTRPIYYPLTLAAACSARHYRIFRTVSNSPPLLLQPTTHDSHRYLRWMILTKQYRTHKMFPSWRFFLTAEIRALSSYQSDTDETKKNRNRKKAIASPNSRARMELPITSDFSLRVKWHKWDKYESNFIYAHTRTLTRTAIFAVLKLREPFCLW